MLMIGDIVYLSVLIFFGLDRVEALTMMNPITSLKISRGWYGHSRPKAGFLYDLVTE